LLVFLLDFNIFYIQIKSFEVEHLFKEFSIIKNVAVKTFCNYFLNVKIELKEAFVLEI